jgi:hypothetical protein
MVQIIALSFLVFMITNLGKPDFILRLIGQNWKGSKRQLRSLGFLNQLPPVLLLLFQGNFVPLLQGYKVGVRKKLGTSIHSLGWQEK